MTNDSFASLSNEVAFCTDSFLYTCVHLIVYTRMDIKILDA